MKFKSKLEKVKLLTDNVRGFQLTRFFGERFTQVKQYSPPGVDSSPSANARPLVEAIGGDMSQLMVSDFIDGVAKTAEQGEIRVYSTPDGTTVAAFVFAKKDGTLQLNGEDNGGLIKIVELVNWLNTHTHASAGTGIPNVELVQAAIENTTVVHGGGES